AATLETFRDTCGLSTFMTTPFASATRAAAAAAVAAVFPQEIREHLQRREIRGVKGEPPFAPGLHEVRRDEPIQVMVERRPGDLELLLERGRGDAGGAGL